ncbi:hypothetical protein GGS24DRAFT_485220 [Hypoxylon argillaceum]|nr:hypothetical protein GGS24DRAFT_485220 [Hypoxylon argillaceum]
MVFLCSLTQTKAAVPEKQRRQSFGIGGAGNIRTRDQAVVHDVYDLVERRRRRMSSASADSSPGERASRRSSSISEALKHAFTSSSK